MLIPTSNRVLVRPDPVEYAAVHKIGDKELTVIDGSKKTIGYARLGTVLDVGEGQVTRDGEVIPIRTVKKGSRVVYFHGGGLEVEHEGETLRLINVDDIYAVVSDEKEAWEKPCVKPVFRESRTEGE